MKIIDFIKWDAEKYSVKVQSIDVQHKKIVEFINRLYNAFVQQTMSDSIQEILIEMTIYAKFHFEYEEKYFTQFRYAFAENHIAEHNDFVKKVEEFKQQFLTKKTNLSFAIVNFLKEWLLHHIAESDKKFSECFVQNGLK